MRDGNESASNEGLETAKQVTPSTPVRAQKAG